MINSTTTHTKKDYDPMPMPSILSVAVDPMTETAVPLIDTIVDIG